MPTPQHPVTLAPEQIADLNSKLADMRHNVNNHLSLLVAAAELIQRRPESAARFSDTLSSLPQKVSEEVRAFSSAFEAVLEITRQT